MSWKTISFAALILDPLGCELVPVDRHVLARLGYQNNNSPQNRSTYLRIEAEVLEERDQAGMSSVPLGIYHWYKWEEYRQLKGWSKADEGLETHRPLSCRDY